MTESSAASLPPSLAGRTVAFLGGTGQLGRSLGGRFAAAGIPVVLGSRSLERAEAAAAEVRARRGGTVIGALNADAAQHADITVIAVPFGAQADVLHTLHGPLRGKLVIDAVNPLTFDAHGATAVHVWEGSAAQQAAALLSESTVTSAFHTVAAAALATDHPLDSDVLVLGDDRAAVATVIDLVGVVDGLTGLHAGGLRNSAQVEALVANLIAINRAHEAATGEQIHAGIRITGASDR
ncbi:NADPH-dependent F420 reductase [Nocardioides sp.]|uniref:NADPH-dependent F420 reductase n=1 Tax=Nocardioides sp. TaxID=35761 RepID=UPI0026146A71|nr:NADPH-dependent F420 reductase [Nocardioides sp.]